MKNKMRILKIILAVLAIACSLVFVPWSVLSARFSPLPKTVQEQVNKATDYGLDGIIVCVNRPTETKVYTAGWKNRAHKIPADPQSLFKIASISKLYIAVAVAKLANDKSLSLDKKLADYLPELAGRIENADKISLSLLVQHRSGIPNFTDRPDFPWANPPKNNREPLELVLDMPADFEPDKKYSYSNTNYLLIGEILDKTLGYSHHQYIKKEILDPLHLNNTYSLLTEINTDDLMSGYYAGYPDDIKYNDFISPGGSMIASVQDVSVFLRALNDGSLLNDEEQAIYSSIYKYEHTGLLPGFQSIARYHKDMDAVVVQFVNSSGGNAWAKSEIMYNKIVKIVRKRVVSKK